MERKYWKSSCQVFKYKIGDLVSRKLAGILRARLNSQNRKSSLVRAEVVSMLVGYY